MSRHVPIVTTHATAPDLPQADVAAQGMTAFKHCFARPFAVPWTFRAFVTHFTY